MNRMMAEEDTEPIQSSRPSDDLRGQLESGCIELVSDSENEDDDEDAPAALDTSVDLDVSMAKSSVMDVDDGTGSGLAMEDEDDAESDASHEDEDAADSDAIENEDAKYADGLLNAMKLENVRGLKKVGKKTKQDENAKKIADRRTDFSSQVGGWHKNFVSYFRD